MKKQELTQTAQKQNVTPSEESSKSSENKKNYSIKNTNKGYYSVQNQNGVELQIFNNREDAVKFIKNLEECDNKKEGKDSYLVIQREGNEECPFMVIKCKDGYFIALGNARMSEFKETEKECWEIIDQKPWGLIFAMINYLLTQRIMGGLIPQKGDK